MKVGFFKTERSLVAACMVAFVFGLFAASLVAMAQDGTVSNGDFFSELIKQVSAMISGKPKAIIIVGTVVQLLIKLINTPMVGGWFASKNGLVKMIVVGVLAIAGMVLDSVIKGAPIMAAITDGVLLTFIMGWVNELIKHVKELKAKPVASLL